MIGMRDQPVQRFCRVKPAVVLRVPVLGDKLLHAGHLPVDAAGIGDAANGVDVLDNVFGHGLVGRGEACAGLEIGRVAHDEIDSRFVRQIFVHIKADGEGIGHLHEHDRERKRNNRDGRFAAAAAKVCPCHARQARSGMLLIGMFASMYPARAYTRIGVAHGFDGGDARGHFARPVAGDTHGQQRKNGRADKDQRVEGYKGAGIRGLRHDDRRQPNADHKADHPAERDTCKRQQERLPPDHAADLLAGRADGLEQAVKADIVCHRDLKHVVDNQIAGEHNEQQHRGERKDGHGIGGRVDLCGRVAPVDADRNIVFCVWVVALVAVVCQHLFGVFPNVEGAVEHHVQMPFAGLALGRARGKCAQFLSCRARQDDVGRDNRAVVLPPAGEGEGALDILRALRIFVDADRYGELCAHFWLDAEQRKHAGVGCGLVRALAWQVALDRFDEIVFCLVFVHVADLDVAFVKRRFVTRHADEQACTGFLGQRVALKLKKLFFTQVFERGVHIAARLPEVLLLERIVDGRADRKERGKQHGRQRDGEHGDDVARFCRFQAAVGQAADALFVGDV